MAITKSLSGNVSLNITATAIKTGLPLISNPIDNSKLSLVLPLINGTGAGKANLQLFNGATANIASAQLVLTNGSLIDGLDDAQTLANVKLVAIVNDSATATLTAILNATASEQMKLILPPGGWGVFCVGATSAGVTADNITVSASEDGCPYEYMVLGDGTWA